MSPWALNRFINAVTQGAVFGYPTDTVWGFGCHPQYADSVGRILQIKRRSPDKGLILLASELDYCLAYVNATSAQLNPLQVATKPTTWLVEASEYCPPWIRGHHQTVAIRITEHPFLRQLCGRLETPIVSTSANRSGCSTVRNALQMQRRFGAQLDFIVTGFVAGNGRPSEIKSLASGAILRGGN